jgi:hypothetical protein
MKKANPVSMVLRAATAASALIVAGCGKAESAGPKSSAGGVAQGAAMKSAMDWFSIKVGDRTLRMQLAVRPKELERGLMERRDLGADDAMVFVFGRPQGMSFWMRNTPTPLDIGGRAAGILSGVSVRREAGALAEPTVAVCRRDEPRLVQGERSEAGRSAGDEGLERGAGGAGI